MQATLPFIVRRSKIQGRGVFATRTIRKGARIVEYVGERITHEEADRRYDDARARNHHTMLFSLDEVSCIDAAHLGNDARFINHSCEPNCEAIQEGDREFIFALTTIREGTELSYDYRYEYDPKISFALAKRRYPCRCGTPSCRGTIVVPPERAPKTAQKNALRDPRRGRKAS
jgi:SET domain-containing protein